MIRMHTNYSADSAKSKDTNSLLSDPNMFGQSVGPWQFLEPIFIGHESYNSVTNHTVILSRIDVNQQYIDVFLSVAVQIHHTCHRYSRCCTLFPGFYP